MSKILKSVALAALCIVAIVACTDKTDENLNLTNNRETESEIKSKNEYEKSFAEILSAAITDRQDVREFLKAEALRKFDNNYDILYAAVKSEAIDNETFKEVLSAYETTTTLDEIEENVPLLNIYLTKTAFLDVYPEELDVTDAETPVAVVSTDSTLFYTAGAYDYSISSDEIPDYHVFVVGENSRIILETPSSSNLKSACYNGFTFKDSSFDGLSKSNLKSTSYSTNNIGSKVKQAYSYFNKSDNSAAQMAFQRDYLYFDITPQKQSGAINHSVSEYLCYIKVDPKAYYKMADDLSNTNYQKDPVIKEANVDQRKRKLSEKELIERMWTKGVYDFRFDVVDSKAGEANVIFVAARPEELWNFNVSYWYRHKTKFRHSKHHYSIDVNNFTAKEFHPSTAIDLGKWHITEESLYRYFKIWEEDEGVEVSDRYTYDLTKMTSKNFKGDVKLSLGFGAAESNKNQFSASFSADITKTTTEKISKEVATKYTDKSDYLGKVAVYYYDPIVTGKNSDGTYKIHEYNTGYISFAITVK